jgi:hypothetical protein
MNATSFWEMSTVATMPSVLLKFSCCSQEFLTFPAFHHSRLGLLGSYADDRSRLPHCDLQRKLFAYSDFLPDLKPAPQREPRTMPNHVARM